jgi:hypothetical protein
MRIALLAPLVLAGCPREGGEAPPAPPPVPRLEARPLAEGARVVVDGRMDDDGWRRRPELVVPLAGGGPGEVRLVAVHDAERLYLRVTWKDEAASANRYWRYEGKLKWSRSEREDGFAICWAPGAEAASFRAQGCAMTCHGGHHVYPGDGNGAFDFWYWGVQQTGFTREARDLWLRQGDNQRLRGDRQPADSDNVENRSPKYEGPCVFPQYRRKGDDRVVFHGPTNKEVTPEWIEKYWNEEVNLGREVPIDLLRARKGSRGDVQAAARHAGTIWVLELARDFETGNTDDLPLGDPVVPAVFALAVYDDGQGDGHAVSGPIELHFLPAP